MPRFSLARVSGFPTRLPATLARSPLAERIWSALPLGCRSALKRWVPGVREAAAARYQRARPRFSGQATGAFCIYPWRSLQIYDTGEARVCCKFQGPILKDGSPMTVHTSSLDEIWNSDEM